MNKNKFILGIVALALVVAAGVAVVSKSGVFGGGGAGPTHYTKESFLEGAFLGVGRGVDIARNGDITSTSTKLKIGKLEYKAVQQRLAVSTTTPCRIQAPTNATSTLRHASLTIETASSTALTFTAAKNATGGYATTTKISSFSLSSGVKGTMVASTTAVSAGAPVVDDVTVFGPGQWLVWAITGLTHTGFDSTKLTGVCSAEFLVTGTNL